MRKLNKIQATAIAFVMAIAVAIPVLAQDAGEGSKEGRGGKWGHRGNRGGGGFMGRGFRDLDLTDAQKAQMKQIREAQQQTLQPLRQELRAKRQEMRKASEGGTFDEALVRQKLIEIAPIEAKLMSLQFRAHQEMLSVLTPEQRTKLEQKREEFKSRKGERGSRNRQTSL